MDKTFNNEEASQSADDSRTVSEQPAGTGLANEASVLLQAARGPAATSRR